MTTNTGYEQPRISGGDPRTRRGRANLAGNHSVLKELGVGTNDPASALHIVKETAGAGVLIERIQATVNAGAFQGRKSRGTLDNRAAVADDDDLLTISGFAYVGDNNSYQETCRIEYEVDGSVSDASKGAPGRIVFRTSSGSGLTKRMRITKDGKVGIGLDDPSTKLTVEGAITMKEQSAADTDAAAYGQMWVKTATPNELYFTTDAGNDIQITSGTSLAAGGMTSFQLEDGDGTEVAISNAKEVKFVEGQGIDINWTDTDNGTDGDPYDLTFTVNLEGTELASTGEGGGSKFLREDGDGTCSWQTVSGSGGMSSFFLEDGDGTEVEIGDAKEVKFIEGGGIDINWTDTSTGSDADPYDLTFTVSDTTVAGDSGSTAITPGDTLTIAGGTNVTTAMSGDTLTITSTDTNTMGSGFVLEDGDGTEVTITENKEVKFIEGGGIDINWTDTSTGSDADPYDLTFTVADTTVAGDSGSTAITPGDTLTIAGGTNCTTAMSGDTLTVNATDTNTMGSGFVLEDGDGTEVTVTENKEVKFVEGGGIDIDWTDVSPGSDADPYDLTFTVSDTTVAGDSGSTGITPGDTLTIAGGTNVTTAMSGDTLTITSTDTNTMGSGFVLEDGDGTEVAITENKEVKFIEGTGIDINWTDTDNGTDGDPYDLTFTCNLEGTELVSTGETGGSKFLREDGDGTCSWQTVSGGGGGDVEAGSTFTTAGVIMACDGDDKTIDEPNALLTTNGQGMTVSAALATPFQVDSSTRDGNSTFKFTTGSGSGTNNQASILVIAQTSANANLYLGDTDSSTRGGLKYKNNGDSLVLVAAGADVMALDSDKVVEFKIAEETDSGSDYAYDSKVLKIKVNGTDYYLPLYAEAGGGGMGGP